MNVHRFFRQVNGASSYAARSACPGALFFSLFAVFSMSCTWHPVAQAAPRSNSIPAEEARLDTEAFRRGLRQRGLTDLLELHLEDFPPQETAATKLLLRDVKMAEYADAARPMEERMAAVAQANQLLEEVIRERPEDPDRFEWQFELAHSLLYDEAEPLFTAVLYRGGSPAERAELQALTGRAVETLLSLNDSLKRESARLDNLAIEEYERLDRIGYIEKIDRLIPKTDYLLLWALFYDAVPRHDMDPTRTERLHRLRRALEADPAIIETPHEKSHVQVQSLALAGMALRRLHDYSGAGEYLRRALAVADGISDVAERERIRWAVTLAWLERIRTARDAGRFDDAQAILENFRGVIESDHGGNFGLYITAAMLERSIKLARAAAAEAEGHQAEAAQWRNKAWRVMARLARQHPDRRDQVYATVYANMPRDADSTQLDPFEQSALIAGLLFDAADTEDEAEADRTLQRAIDAGKRFLAHADTHAAQLVPEVRYNVAVSEYRRGHVADAARQFLSVARKHPAFNNALQAASYAVQLAANLHADPSLQDHPEVNELYLDALELLLTQYTDSDAARYWRFYYAQLLEDLDRLDEAAEQYALVVESHPHFVESAFFRVRCLARALKRITPRSPDELLELRNRAHAFFSAHRDFVTKAAAARGREDGSIDKARLSRFLDQARLLKAEVQVTPGIDRPTQALDGLAGLPGDERHDKSLAARVWRVRLLAYEQLGRLEEAAGAIPPFVAADPAAAGPTLQSLYLAMADDVARLRANNDDELAQQRADVALLLAKHIVEWAERDDTDPTFADRRALDVQLAEAYLQAGRYAEARVLFEQLLGATADRQAPAAKTDVRVVHGYAEALYQLGAYEKALPRFNALAVGLSPADETRWQALLRDLQCRTALGQSPHDVIKVIEQQRYLHPQLGGPVLSREFEKLQRENQRRADRG